MESDPAVRRFLEQRCLGLRRSDSAC